MGPELSMNVRNSVKLRFQINQHVLITYLITYLLTYSLHGAESFLRS